MTSRFDRLVREHPELAVSLLDSVAEGVVVVDHEGRFLGSNPAANRLLGIGARNVPPERWSEAYGLFDMDGATPLPPAKLPLVRAMAGEDADDVELLIRNPRVPQGVWLLASARPLRSADGAVEGAVVVLKDITVRRKIEGELREQTARVDLLKRIAVAANEARTMEQAMHTAIEIVGTSVGWRSGHAYVFSDDADPVLELVATWEPEGSAPSTGGKPYVPRISLLDVVSSRHPMWVFDVSARGAQPAPGRRAAFAFPVLAGPAVVAVIEFRSDEPMEPDPRLLDLMENVGTQLGRVVERDRTQRKLESQSRELVRSNSELEQFAYVASHELKEPVRTIGSYLKSFARRTPDLDDEARALLDSATDAARRMQTTIEDLLAFSRISREERPLAAVDCEWVFERATGNLAAAIEDAGATVTSDMLPAVWGDEAQLVQLFQNLVANGIKFRGDAPPQVHVSAQLENGEWAFSIRDNGIGIAPEDVPRLFTIFERLHSQEAYPGTGIGLALCKRIVERHGGRIGVESTPGKGSVFHFTLYPAPERG